MNQCPRLLYAGNDEVLYHALTTYLPQDVCRWEMLDDPYQVVERLQTTPPLESLADDSTSLVGSFRERYAAVILDPEIPPESATALLREIKEYDGGMSVIMITSQPTSVAISLARIDGAEACFVKPVEPMEPLVEAIRTTLRKFERWEESLRAALACSGKKPPEESPATEFSANP